MASVTEICRDLSRVHAALQRKIKAIQLDMWPKLPKGWSLEIFETARTDERAAWLLQTGKSKTKRSKHCTKPKAQAVDLVWKHQNQWTWTAPKLLDGRDGWDALDDCKRAHNLRVISWDRPHCELKPEDV